jgi:hypothetical protein
MLLGTAVWLVVAGLVEGFVTPSGQALGTVLVIGVGLAAVLGRDLLAGASGRDADRPTRPRSTLHARATSLRYASTHASPNRAGALRPRCRAADEPPRQPPNSRRRQFRRPRAVLDGSRTIALQPGQ